ncbi:hypothetical protein CLV63_1293 [Murinocardiopsis flavida]|uniref:Uncharacterized protein n=1 Tax=Murinocardiopsis flavida TaxID=645275 RepID=A0A2P8CUT3_9ACTN|nr:hypothetical protein [Murinocardiopsis flavida]PSK88717.1 hypothetical protein CLV63_1293 [Murinocardiopsis flavida]
MSTSVPKGGWPETRAELARRHGVSESTVKRALDTAAARHSEEPDRNEPPPQPVNPGAVRNLRWLPSEFDPWWRNRRRRGRPPKES